MEKFCITIEIKDKEKVWLRSIVLPAVPETEDLMFYYKHICGLENITLEIKVEQVPEGFNEVLLSCNKAPSTFPASDLEIHAKDEYKWNQYKQYIKQLCDMERTRANLKTFTTEPEPEQESEEEAESDGKRKNYRSLGLQREWVQEILRSLNEDQEYEDALELVQEGKETIVPLGWIITPTMENIRLTKGSRFIVDQELGQKWENVLGTDLYPDFLISRRISTANWRFQHEGSVKYLQATMDWYLLSQDAQITGGVSSWVYEADREFNIFLAAIRKIKINERLLQQEDNYQSQVFKILSTIENQYLESSTENSAVHPMTSELFFKFMKYVFLTSNIPKEQFWGLENFRKIIVRWERSLLGFKPNMDPFIAGWKDMWNILMHDQVTQEKMSLFIQTLDVWDPNECMLYTSIQRNKLTKTWINLYIETQMIPDQDSVVRSPILHERVQGWVFKFLPQELFKTHVNPMSIGPTFTAKGYVTTKTPTGRWTAGVKYKETDIPPVFSETFHPVAQEPKKKGRKKKNETTEHNLVVHEQSEIHLGKV